MFVSRSFLRYLKLGRDRFSVLAPRMAYLSRTLSFDAYDAYGFDIDHTLAKYNLPNLFKVPNTHARCYCQCRSALTIA